jgi:peptidoglycan/LPS O-acetylase OafA/YrhL
LKQDHSDAAARSGRRSTEIDQLTGLRGVAALWVFAFHVSDWLGRLQPGARGISRWLGSAGFLGVDLFFVLSGFVIALNYAASDLHSSAPYCRYLWKRLARLYPVHLFALALVGALQAVYAILELGLFPRAWFTQSGLVATLLLTNGWAMPIPKAWNIVSWSVSCEWAAYLLFPLAALLANAMRSQRSILLLIVSLFVLLGHVVWTGHSSGTMAYGMPRVAAGFVAGVLLHRLWQLRGLEQDARNGRLALMALATLLAGGSVLASLGSSRLALALLPILACPVVYGLASSAGPLCRVLATPASLWAGRVSYSFYMVHLTVLNAVGSPLRILGAFEDGTSAVAAAVAALLLAGLLAHWTYTRIESPCRRALTRFSLRDLRAIAAGRP